MDELVSINSKIEKLESKMEALEKSILEQERIRAIEKIELSKEFSQLRSELQTSNKEMINSLKELKMQIRNEYLETKIKDLTVQSDKELENNKTNWIVSGSSKVAWTVITVIITAVLGTGIGLIINSIR